MHCGRRHGGHGLKCDGVCMRRALQEMNCFSLFESTGRGSALPPVIDTCCWGCSFMLKNWNRGLHARWARLQRVNCWRCAFLIMRICELTEGLVAWPTFCCDYMMLCALMHIEGLFNRVPSRRVDASTADHHTPSPFPQLHHSSLNEAMHNTGQVCNEWGPQVPEAAWAQGHGMRGGRGSTGVAGR